MRDYAPLPLEYLAEMAPLSDADFGRLVRALLLYAKDGTPVALDGDCRFYCARVMNKDEYYAEKFAEEEEKAEKRRAHAKKAINARYAEKSEGEESPVLPEYTREGNNITYQSSSSHDTSTHNTSSQINSVGAEPEEASAAAPAIPLVDGSEYCVKVKELEEWKKAFPAVDVVQELGEMRAWCLSNPTLRKTKKGVRRFINTWLSREQDKGHTGQAVKPQPERAFVPSEL